MKSIATVLAIALIVVGTAYSLNRGFFIGSKIEHKQPYWHLVCDYLFPSGVRVADTGGWGSPQEAKSNRHCPLFFE